MKLILFGGVERDQNQVEAQLNLIKNEVLEIHLKQVLIIPFAREHSPGDEWKRNNIESLFENTDIQILYADSKVDLPKAQKPLVIISGGHEHVNLIEKITNIEIMNIINHSDSLIAESAGAMILGKYFRESLPGSKMIKGLNLIEDTIIEPHYRERAREKLLKHEVRECKARYGLGVDCATGIKLDSAKFPKHIEKFGLGNFYLIENI